MAAFFELARLFSLLYNQSKSQPAVNLLFVLTPTGHHSFAATASVLSQSNHLGRLLVDLQQTHSAQWALFVLLPFPFIAGISSDPIFSSFLDVLDTRTIESLSLAISLDSLVGDSDEGKLFLHSSRSEKDSLAKKVFDVRRHLTILPLLFSSSVFFLLLLNVF